MFWKVLMGFDLMFGCFMLSQPALFAELIYPLLTPGGILLAIYLLAWWRLGRFMVSLFVPFKLRPILITWLWLASAPLHCAALCLFGRQDLGTAIWHGSHLLMILLAWQRSIRSHRKAIYI